MAAIKHAGNLKHGAQWQIPSSWPPGARAWPVSIRIILIAQRRLVPWVCAASTSGFVLPVSSGTLRVQLLGITCPNSPAALWEREERCKGLPHLDNSLKAGRAAARRQEMLILDSYGISVVLVLFKRCTCKALLPCLSALPVRLSPSGSKCSNTLAPNMATSVYPLPTTIYRAPFLT